MFEEFRGIPLHPLLVHAAVIFLPLQATAALAYGFVPFVRRYITWAVIALAVVAPSSAWAAREAGIELRARLIRNGTSDPGLLAKFEEHQGFGSNAAWSSLALGVLMLVLVFLQWRSATPSAAVGSDSAAGSATMWSALWWVMVGLTVVAAGFTSWYIFKAGDSGAHMVWNGI